MAKSKIISGVFECPTCGLVHLNVLETMSDRALVTCPGCGRFLGTWGMVREELRLSLTKRGKAFELRDGAIKPIR